MKTNPGNRQYEMLLQTLEWEPAPRPGLLDRILSLWRRPPPPSSLPVPNWLTPVDVREAGLSRRELEVFGLMQEGYSSQQISEILGITPGTVKSHGYHIRLKLEQLAAKRRRKKSR